MDLAADITPEKLARIRELLALRGVEFRTGGVVTGLFSGTWSYDGKNIDVRLGTDLGMSREEVLEVVQNAVREA